jgi:hypothetical protein
MSDIGKQGLAGGWTTLHMLMEAFANMNMVAISNKYPMMPRLQETLSNLQSSSNSTKNITD